MIQKSLAGLGNASYSSFSNVYLNYVSTDGEVSITNLDGNDYFSQKRGPKSKKGFISGQNSLTDSIF